MTRATFRPTIESLEDRTLLATCTVTNLLDVGRGGTAIGSGQIVGDLRFCINQANAMPGPDEIDFTVTGTINLTGALPVLASDVDIEGSGSDVLTIRRDTGGDYRILTVNVGVTAEVSGLTLANGSVKAWGGALRNDGTLTLMDVALNGNVSLQYQGGGLYNAGMLTGRSVRVSNNYARGFLPLGNGAGIYNAGRLELHDSAVSSNRLDRGSGAGIYNSSKLILVDTEVTGNMGSQLGYEVDGLGIYNSGLFELHGGTLSGNMGNAAALGGGLFNVGATSLADCLIAANQATSGGGIYNRGALALTRCQVIGNTASSPAAEGSFFYGGGIYNHSSATATITASAISGNVIATDKDFARGYGGGIYNQGELIVSSSAITDNRITLNGEPNGAFGAGLNDRGGTVSITSTTIAGNELAVAASAKGSADAYGGGISSEGGVVTLVGCAVVGNSAFAQGQSSEAKGGGLYGDGLVIRNTTIGANSTFAHGIGVHPSAWSTGGGAHARLNLVVANSTVAGNTAFGVAIDGILHVNGGGIYGSNMAVSNSIVAGNAADGEGNVADGSPDLDGTLATSGHNLFGVGQGGSGYDSTDILDVDPLLGPLADNGGPTLTMALLPDSPAIEAGDNTDAPEFDQRGPGFPRIVNGTIDIGAFEVQFSPAPRPPRFLAFLITADTDVNDYEKHPQVNA